MVILVISEVIPVILVVIPVIPGNRDTGLRMTCARVKTISRNPWPKNEDRPLLVLSQEIVNFRPIKHVTRMFWRKQ